MFLQFTPAYGFAFLQIGISPRAVFHKPPGRKTRCGKRTQTVVFHTVFTPAGVAGELPLPSCRFALSHTPPFVAARHLPPERGKSALKGTAFGSGGKAFYCVLYFKIGLTACALSVKAYGFASSPKGRAKSTPGSFLIIPNTLATNVTAWLSLWESWRGSA